MLQSMGSPGVRHDLVTKQQNANVKVKVGVIPGALPDSVVC